MTTATLGLPDPDAMPEFYADTATKRALAWVVDVTVVALLSLIAVPFTLFTALFYLPVLMMTVGFIYRTATLARYSATPGMRLLALELRDANGARFDLPTAVGHTLGYAVSILVFPLQLISIALMVTTPRAQSLTDHGLGTAAVNRAAAIR